MAVSQRRTYTQGSAWNEPEYCKALRAILRVGQGPEVAERHEPFNASDEKRSQNRYDQELDPPHAGKDRSSARAAAAFAAAQRGITLAVQADDRFENPSWPQLIHHRIRPSFTSDVTISESGADDHALADPSIGGPHDELLNSENINKPSCSDQCYLLTWLGMATPI